MEENEALVELLEEVLGDHGLHYPNRGQISFNCPVCDDGRNKHNMEVNYIDNVYKCWSCGDSEGTHGALGITDEMIEKFGIGFCDKGDHAGRIVIPSYNTKGELNYYIARSWNPMSRAKYKNPEAEKDKIIFWENLIDWNKDIYLVEGAFDGLFVDNPIPMLGKHMSELLFETIYKKAKADIIICLDADAWENAVKLYHELHGGEL